MSGIGSDREGGFTRMCGTRIGITDSWHDETDVSLCLFHDVRVGARARELRGYATEFYEYCEGWEERAQKPL